MFVDGIGARRLRALVNGLPDDAAVWREERRQAEGWTQHDELLAVAIEMQSMWFRILAQLAGPKFPNQLPKPTEITRPEWLVSEKSKPKVETDARVISAFFQQHFDG